MFNLNFTSILLKNADIYDVQSIDFMVEFV